jgi:site-specific DNA-methyltransferase (adenine-specific)
MKREFWHGDCLTEMKRIQDGSVDMVLCDLPYGTTQNKWDSVIPFEPLWEQYWRVLKRNGAVVLTAAQPFTSALVMSQVKQFKYSWTWNKLSPTGHLNAKKQPMRKTEDVLVFSLIPPPYNPQGLSWNPRVKSRKSTSVGSSSYGKHSDVNIAEYQGYPTNLLEIKQDRDKLHPTQKPVALFEYLIKTYTNPGETVLDNCAGSGTTAIAAMNTGRGYICIERDDEYFRRATERVASQMI